MISMKTRAVDRLLETLGDGKWHPINAAISEAKIEQDRAWILVSFLENYGFVHYCRKIEKIKLDALTKRFLQKLENNEVADHLEMTA